MKKFYYFFAAFLASASVNAQVSLQGALNGYLSVIPEEFSYDGVATLEMERYTDEDDYVCFDIYNDEIEKIKTVRFELPKYKFIEQERTISEVVITSTDMSKSDFAETFDVAQHSAAEYGFSVVMDGNKFYPNDNYSYFEYEKLGNEYPREYMYWNPDDSTLCFVHHEYEAKYLGEWVDVCEREEEWVGYPVPVGGFNLTQTLFNRDDKYEVVLPAANPDAWEVYYSSDYDGDGVDEHRTIKKGVAGYNVVSEDGTIVATFEQGGTEKDGFSLLKMNDKVYMVFDYYTGGEKGYYIYKIDSETRSISKVATMDRIKVSPTVANRSQDITVEFDGNGDVNEVVVVNAAGQTMKRLPVASGQKRVVINASELGKGMNVINARGAKESSNMKIIVK